MRMPKAPPNWGVLLLEAGRAEALGKILQACSGPSVRGKYLHWDRLIRHTPPPGLSHAEWWLALKLQRETGRQRVPLVDKGGQEFGFVMADPIPEWLHNVDLGAGGQIEMPEQITNPDTRDRYYVASLMDEAITSSQLEGAATTRLVAKEMIRSKRTPRDTSERMILNNYLTMRRIGDLKGHSLTPELVCEIHRQVAEDTLDDTSAAGRIRRPGQEVVVDDYYGEVFHDPPPAEELPRRLEAMCDFANGKTPTGFVHPALRAIILHFWLAYDHPFSDGNGRTARALFYWAMLHRGYWLFEFISISQIIRGTPTRYARAFLYTETDGNDLTYFILYHLKVIRTAVDALHGYIQRKTDELRAAEAELRGVTALNHRQRALISHALRHPRQRYTVEAHRVSHNVVHQTARADLLDLMQRGLVRGQKAGRTWHFRPADDLAGRLAEL